MNETERLQLRLEQLEIQRFIRQLVRCFLWSQFIIVSYSVVRLIVKGVKVGFY